jgi:LacI family transcriptional regulator
VTTQNREGARKLADFLVAGGHKTFGYISGLENSSTNRDRFEGFREGLAAHGFTDIIVRTGNYSRADAETAARQLFALENRPEAVFVANDHMAVAVMDVARYEFGLTIPDDLSVVGYDDVGPARWPAYGITTVTQPIEGMVEAAVRILMTQIASGEMISEHELLPGELIVRTSAIRPRNGIVTVDGQNLYRPEAQ